MVIADDRVQVRVTAIAQDGEANAAVIALLAAALDVPKRAITLVRGATARHKVLAIEMD